MSHPTNRSAAVSALVVCCFFLSGAAGLIYEVLWVRMIDKVIGSAPFAVATVLSVFMGGLALGSRMAGRYADRLASCGALLGLYGKLEAAIGAYALLLPCLIGAVTPLYRAVYDVLLPHFWLFRLFAFVGCSLLLIVPTSLMGFTLPVICRFYVTQLDHLATRTGRLYGLNTVGAAVGAVLCGFVLIDSLGVHETLWVAAGINFLVGGACVLLAGRVGRIPGGAPARRRVPGAVVRPKAGPGAVPGAEKTSMAHPHTSSTSSGPAPDRSPVSAPEPGTDERDGALKWALVIAAVSGFCSMACEVLWTRLLGLLMGPTGYSFTLVVATFIVGLAAGSIVFGRLGDRTRRVFLLLAWTQLGAAALALAVSQFLGNSQFLFAKLIHTLQGGFATMVLAQSVVLFAILVWPTLLLGAVFPLVNRIYARSLHTLGSSIGTAYTVNTIGAILGSFAAGFVIIPLAGKENGLRWVTGLQFATALAALAWAGFGFRSRHYRWPAAAALAALGVVLAAQFPSWDRNILARGWYRNCRDIGNDLDRTSWLDAVTRGPALLARQRRGLEVVFYGDGVGGFTTVEKETTSLGTVEYALSNSGKPDASSHGDRSTQTLSGHIPLLFHPGAERVMVIGLASGMTLGEVLLYPVKQADVLEINEQVVKACDLFFGPWNNACLTDPRTRLIVQDGRHHLALTRAEYDVIISEPSNPWMAGLANLYTRDFFRLARERLRAGGIFAQWIQSYEMDWNTFALVGRTFADVFPNGALLKTGPGDYLLLGFAGHASIDWKTAEKNMAYARKSTNVRFADCDSLAHLVVTEDLPGLFGEGPLHTDNRPRLEFAAPRQLYGGSLDLDRVVAERRRLSPETRGILRANSDEEGLLELIELAASANVPLFSRLNPQSLAASRKQRYTAVVKRFCGQVVVPSYHLFPDPESKRQCAEAQIEGIRRRLAEDDTHADDHYNLSLSLIAAGREEEARQELERTISLDPWHEDGSTALGLLWAKRGNLPEAVRHLARAVELAPLDADAHKHLGMAEARQGQLEQAAGHLAAALRIAPRDVAALNELGTVLLRQGKVDAALQNFAAAADLAPLDAESHNNLAAAHFRKGDLEKAATHLQEALRLSPGSADVRHNLEMVSRLLREGGKPPVDSRPGS